jgi:hypothetical protein
VPGRHVADHRMRLVMKHRMTETTPVAAARAGFSTATGYRVAQDPRPLSEKRAPCVRRRPDPLADVFDADVVPMLEASPGLMLVAVLEELLRGPGVPGRNSPVGFFSSQNPLSVIVFHHMIYFVIKIQGA